MVMAGKKAKSTALAMADEASIRYDIETLARADRIQKDKARMATLRAYAKKQLDMVMEESKEKEK